MSNETTVQDRERWQRIKDAFIEKGDFPAIMEIQLLEGMLLGVMEFDEEYMENSGVNAGAVYDDDAAYLFMHTKMCARYPDYTPYMMRFVEDYMDENETYLESEGLIEWE